PIEPDTFDPPTVTGHAPEATRSANAIVAADHELAGKARNPSPTSARRTSRTRGVDGCGTSTASTSNPARFPKYVVARTWWLPAAPSVTTRVAPRARASAMRRSRFRALLPP